MSDTEGQIRDLLSAVMDVSGDLELSTVLDRIVRAATELADCQYGALGVLGERPESGTLVEFLAGGIDDAQRDLIGELPHGRGILGLLISDPQPLRLRNLTDHPSSVGFPANHPPMKSFLGVPIRIRGEVFGNLYLTEKRGGVGFDAADESVVLTLASAAGVAIDNARLYGDARRNESWQRASAAITRSLLGGTDATEVLPAVLGTAREITRAATAVVAFANRESGVLEIEVADGSGASGLIGQVLRIPQPAHLIPLIATRTDTAVLVVANVAGGSPFSASVLKQLEAFVHQVSVAFELADTRRAAEQVLVFEDRDRIARDLHDLVIQRLFASGMQLNDTAASLGTGEAVARINRVVDDLDGTIRDIRSAIFGLKTLERDQLPLLGARLQRMIDALAPTLAFGLSVKVDDRVDDVVSEEIADDVVAVVREAISNVARHSKASAARLEVQAGDDNLVIRVTDNGEGFSAELADPATEPRRSGLANLEARAAKYGGTFSAGSGSDGEWTHQQWVVPISYPC